MITPRAVLRAFIFGAITETAALALSFGLYSLNYGREPTEPPFNWTATLLQMPGIFVLGWLGPKVGDSAWCHWTIIFLAQALLWAAIALVLQIGRVGRNTSVGSARSETPGQSM